jgi:sugar (pentulose or hexulose) kinase
MGLEPKMVIVTGGGSANSSITKIIADVFGTSVLASSQTDSASLGAALRAYHGWLCEENCGFVPYAEATKGCPSMDYITVAEPCKDAHATYTEMLKTYKTLEDKVVDSC